MTQFATLLVVDDNTPFRSLLSAFLKKSGYAALEAADGQEALEALSLTAVDAVLLDLQMQPMGGFDFMRRFREMGHAMPVILVTGDPSTDILTRATQMGFAGVMKKPVTETHMLRMIARVTTPAAPIAA